MSGDLQNLQGSWNIVSLELEGQMIPAGMLGGARIVIQEDRFVSLAMGATYEGSIEINAALNTQDIQIAFHDGS